MNFLYNIFKNEYKYSFMKWITCIYSWLAITRSNKWICKDQSRICYKIWIKWRKKKQKIFKSLWQIFTGNIQLYRSENKMFKMAKLCFLFQ